jgi:hypothetical protein
MLVPDFAVGGLGTLQNSSSGDWALSTHTFQQVLVLVVIQVLVSHYDGRLPWGKEVQWFCFKKVSLFPCCISQQLHLRHIQVSVSLNFFVLRSDFLQDFLIIRVFLPALNRDPPDRSLSFHLTALTCIIENRHTRGRAFVTRLSLFSTWILVSHHLSEWHIRHLFNWLAHLNTRL